MDDSGGRQRRFDERAALEELERVREQIERSRSQRRALQEEFSRWVRSFERPAEPTGAEPAEQPRASSAAVAAAPLAAPVPRAEPAAADTPATIGAPPVPTAQRPGAAEPPASLEHPAATAIQPDASEPPALVPAPPAVAGPPRALSRSSVLAGGGVILLVAGAMATWMLRGEVPPPEQVAQVPPADRVSQVQPAPPEAEPAPSPPPAVAPAEPVSQGSELVTIRRVWLRVLVDGERVLEREVPAGTRVPLRPQKTIVIRTGDAGAVRLSLAGDDRGFLGREGEVVTRTFAVPPR